MDKNMLKILLKQTVKATFNRLGLEIRKRPRSDTNQIAPVLVDQPAWINQIIERVRPYTMTGPERVATLCNAVEYIEAASIEGDIVECGVWKGGSMMAAALSLLHLKKQQREFYLYDTYEGMTDPTEKDITISGKSAWVILDELADVYPRRGSSPLSEVQTNMGATGYPVDLIHYVKGRVEDTIAQKVPDQIAILRLDTDWYESTMYELERLWPRLAIGGICIIDDYGFWKGCRQAVSEYFENKPVFLNRVDETARLIVKQ
jgi:O-methyltransferase